MPKIHKSQKPPRLSFLENVASNGVAPRSVELAHVLDSLKNPSKRVQKAISLLAENSNTEDTEKIGEQLFVTASRRHLAKLMNCSLITARRAIYELQSGGWTEVIAVRGKPNIYRLNSEQNVKMSRPKEKKKERRVIEE